MCFRIEHEEKLQFHLQLQMQGESAEDCKRRSQMLRKQRQQENRTRNMIRRDTTPATKRVAE